MPKAKGEAGGVPAPTASRQIIEATGWQPHTVRGALRRLLKKRLGLDVTSEKVEEKRRLYQLDA